jgi:hypothetical protein
VTGYGSGEHTGIGHSNFGFGSGNRYLFSGESSDSSSHGSSSSVTELASVQGNNEDIISDMASDLYELRNNSENNADYKRESRQSLGRPVTMEDGSDDDRPTTMMGEDH